MKLLKELILRDGKVINNSILKVDNFLNHQIDPNLMFEIGKEFKNRFSEKKITKVLTIEASGIAIGTAVAYFLGVPLVFAKKKKPSTMADCYCSKVMSFTKNIEYDINISKEFLKENDHILIVDDFLAMGGACTGLIDITKQSGANIVGIGIVIEKTFQSGRGILEQGRYHIESLAQIKGFDNNQVIF